MTPERHQQIKRLFLAAVELGPRERQQFLDGACGDDQGLRGEVQSLLDHHRTDTLLEAPQSSETVGTLPATIERELKAALAASPAFVPRPPGTLIAGRYRLVSPLGRGGMGVVYRAEDLELGQTVALKFLGPQLKGLDGAVEMLRGEVRIARQITHPNVVRVYDIAAADGEVFISMEFVAGEDLESLVRRVGRLAPAKVLQLGRQLAAGLAAAHEAGILHRDLKPANVMIDGEGNVRILDFGIAAALADRQALGAKSGTPGFVAPELVAGQIASPQSDLYSWGLVVYYAATGTLPTAAQVSAASPADEVLVASDIDARLVECARSCLQSNPALRPKSAYDLVLELTAGDPLLATIRSGRTPSPELVTAAPSWQPPRRLLDALLVGGTGLLILVTLLADRSLFLSRCGLVKSPVALREIAEQTLTSLGHPLSRPLLTGVSLDTDCLKFVRGHPGMASAWQAVRAGQIPAVSYWYRQGDPRLPRPALLGEPDSTRLHAPKPGTAEVRLDGRGKLLSLQAATIARDDEPRRATAVDWAALFEAGGLRLADFRETRSTRWPPLFADELHAWEGPLPVDGQFSLQVTAASLRGQVVYFDVDQPWEQERQAGGLAAYHGQLSSFIAMRTAVWLVACGLAAALAWRNVRRGYVDWLGAWRVAASVMTLAGIDWLIGSRHTLVVAEELTTALLWLTTVVFCGAVAGLAYLAVEPAARRWWPWAIITTRRLLAGQLGDRGIWADALLGAFVGLASVSLRQIATVANQVFEVPVSGLNDFDLGQNLLDSFGLRYKASIFITALLLAVIDSLLILSVVVMLKRLTRSTLTAAVIFVIVFASMAIVGRGIVSPVDWLARTLLWCVAAWLLLRVGLLATIAAQTTFYVVNNTPITLDFTAWYAPTSLLVQAMVLAALIACWRLALPPRELTRAGR